MEQTWLETCFSAHPYNKGYIYTHIPPARSSRTNRLAKRTRICFQTWKDLGLLDLTNLGILPGEPKSYWVFSSRRAGTQRREDHEAARGPFLGPPPLCRAATHGARPCGRSRPVPSTPRASPAVGLGGDFFKPKALSQCLSHRALPLPRRLSGVGASQNPHREPSSCRGDITAPRPGTAAPRPGLCQQSCRAPGH